MQLTKNMAAVILSAVILIACNSNHPTNAPATDGTNNTSASHGSGDDMYYELTTTSTGKEMSINGVTKMFVSSKGDMRSEMNMVSSFKGNKSSVPIIAIAHSNKPDESIIIDDSAKTYTMNHINSDDLDTKEKMESTVTKVGEEKILGFNCVHAKIISKKSIGNFYSTVDTVDIWRSNDVPMQATVKDLMNQFESRTGNFMYSKEVSDQLKQMGCVGFMVKMEIRSKNVSMVMQLTKVEHRDLPASMFEIPAGYTEDKSGM
jgi:Domain of unknown function (DUF4412)